MKYILSIVILFGLVIESHAQDEWIIELDKKMIVDSLKAFEKTFHSSQPGLVTECNDPKNLQKCQNKYKKVLDSSKLDIQIFGGYSDHTQTNLVSDLSEKASFIEKLTSPCSTEKYIKTCGFIRHPDDANILTKKIISKEMKEIEVTLTLSYPAISLSNEDNLKSKDQELSSRKVQESFINALGTADMVFYSGHSRDGGGPDFFPPKLTKGGHVDYSWYKKNQTGLADMLKGLSQRKENKLTYLGLFSCDSKNHFYKNLRNTKVSDIELTTRIVTEQENQNQLLYSLNAGLSMYCDLPVRKNQSPIFSTGEERKI